MAASFDPVVQRHFPHFRDYLGPLVADVEVRKRLDFVRSRLSILRGHLSCYREHLVGDLRAALAAPSPSEKDKLARLTLGLATELSSSGYSQQHLRTGTFTLQKSDKDFPSRLDDLISQFSGERRRYSCTFHVFGPPILTTLNVPSVRFVKGRSQTPLTAIQQEFFAQAAPSDLVAVVEVDALDPVSGRNLAQERLATTFAALVAFEYEKNFGVKGNQVLVETSGSVEQLLPTNSLPRVHFASATKPTARAAELLGLQAEMAPSDMEQLSAALQYHRLAMAAPTDEVRLVNLWIALEGLVRRGEGNSIVDRVCRQIPPTIALGNGIKLLRGLAIYVRSYWSANGCYEPLRGVFPASTAKHLKPNDLLDVLMDVREGPRINKLYEVVDHPLIRFRIHKLRDKALASPDRVARNLLGNRQNVDWQLRRIYRHRNEVIHRASCPPGTPLLLEHLHSYFMGTVHAVLHNLRATGSRWGIPDALEHRALLFDHYVAKLKSDTATNMPRAALIDPAIILRHHEGPAAWPDAVPAEAAVPPGTLPPLKAQRGSGNGPRQVAKPAPEA
jgi:hypothetical protein